MTTTNTQNGTDANPIVSYVRTAVIWLVIILVIVAGVTINNVTKARSIAELSSKDKAVQDAAIIKAANQQKLADALADIQDPNSLPTSDENVADTAIRVACGTEFANLINANKVSTDVAFANLYDLHKDPVQKPMVTTELTTLGKADPKNLKRLVANLGDGDPDVRGASSDALAGIPDDNTIGLLVAAVGVAGEKADALTTLGKIGKPASPALVTMMESAPPPFAQSLIGMLATIGDPSCIPAIEKLTNTNPPDPATRRIALLGLTTIVIATMPPSAAPPVVAPPAAAPGAAPAAAAPAPPAAAAAKPAAAPAAAPAGKPAAPGAKPAAGAKVAAAPAAKPAAAPAPPPPAPAAPPGPSPADIANCQSAGPILTAALNNPADDSRARAQCALAIGRLRTPASINALVKALGDIDTRISVAATNGLGSVGPAAIPALSVAVHDKSETVRIGAASALGSIGTDSAVAAMASALSDPSADVRRNACEALGRSASKAAIPLLAARLSDADGFVAGAASDSLQQLGKPAVPSLVAALGGANQTAAFYASQALTGMGLDAAPEVRVAAQSGSATQKVWSAVVLGQIRDTGSRALLTKMASDPDPKIKFAAHQALDQLGGAAA